MELLKTVFSVAGRASSVAIGHMMSGVSEAVASVKFTETLNKLDVAFTPVLVTVTCRHQSQKKEDYVLDFDLEAFTKALNEGRHARPQIVVRSKYADINRDVLSEKMEAGLRPLFHSFQESVERRKQDITDREESDAFWNALAMLMLTVAGAAMGPLVWLIVGFEGWQALKSLPSLIISSIKSGLYNMIFGSELAQLDSELDAARTTIKRMVRNIKIEPLAE